MRLRIPKVHVRSLNSSGFGRTAGTRVVKMRIRCNWRGMQIRLRERWENFLQTETHSVWEWPGPGVPSPSDVVRATDIRAIFTLLLAFEFKWWIDQTCKIRVHLRHRRGFRARCVSVRFILTFFHSFMAFGTVFCLPRLALSTRCLSSIGCDLYVRMGEEPFRDSAFKRSLNELFLSFGERKIARGKLELLFISFSIRCWPMTPRREKDYCEGRSVGCVMRIING